MGWGMAQLHCTALQVQCPKFKTEYCQKEKEKSKYAKQQSHVVNSFHPHFAMCFRST
jgi:hypothetical protein